MINTRLMQKKKKSRIGDLTLFEKDGSRVNEFLETLENNFNDSNEAKLQKILQEKKNQPQQKNTVLCLPIFRIK